MVWEDFKQNKPSFYNHLGLTEIVLFFQLSSLQGRPKNFPRGDGLGFQEEMTLRLKTRGKISAQNGRRTEWVLKWNEISSFFQGGKGGICLAEITPSPPPFKRDDLPLFALKQLRFVFVAFVRLLLPEFLALRASFQAGSGRLPYCAEPAAVQKGNRKLWWSHRTLWQRERWTLDQFGFNFPGNGNRSEKALRGLVLFFKTTRMGRGSQGNLEKSCKGFAPEQINGKGFHPQQSWAAIALNNKKAFF